MLRRRLCALACLAAFVLALAAAGCGGGGNHAADAAKVRQTVRSAFAALAAGDGAGFCALATADARSQLAQTDPGSTCAAVVQTISRQLSPAVKTALRTVRVGQVDLHGDRASVSRAAITATTGRLKGFLTDSSPPTKLARQGDGTWKISG